MKKGEGGKGQVAGLATEEREEGKKGGKIASGERRKRATCRVSNRGKGERKERRKNCRWWKEEEGKLQG